MNLVPEFVGKSSSELFGEYSIQQLQEVKDQLAKDVNSKKLELRSLVGNNYRDLLKVADDIIQMNDLATQQTTKMSDLTFKKASYFDKQLPNLTKFETFVRQHDEQAAKTRNRSVVLRNVVSHLDYCLEVLRSDVEELHKGTQSFENEDEDSSHDAISAQFIQLGKQVYLIQQFFSNELKNDIFTVTKFYKLKQSFLEDLGQQIANSVGDNDNEYILNLVATYIFTSQVKPIEAFEWFLGLRLVKIKEFELDTDIYTCLNYVFNTLNFLGTLRAKLSTILMRQIYNSSNSNWTATPRFNKYTRWLDIPADYKVDFPLTLAELKNNSDKQLDKMSDEWKIEVGKCFHEKLTCVFSTSSNFDQLSGSLSKVLGSFKKFTSLVDIKYSQDDNLIGNLLETWKTEFLKLLGVDIDLFQSISDLILETYQNTDVLHSVRTTSGLNLFKYTDLSDIDLYISQISSPASSTIESIVTRLVQFKTALATVMESLQGLGKLSNSLTKQVLSIDDHENDQFWESTSKYLNSTLDEGIQYVIQRLNELLKGFLDQITQLTEQEEVSTVKYFYIIRILYQLREKIDLEAIYDNFRSLAVTSQEIETLDLPSLVDELLVKIFKPLVSSISAPYKESLRELVTSRPSKKYPETGLWAVDDAENLVPNTPSLEVENLIYKLSGNLTNVQDNPNEDYGDVYFSDKFYDAKVELIDELVQCLATGEQKEAETEKSEEACETLPEPSINSLLTFADLVFLACFKLKSHTENELSAIVGKVDSRVIAALVEKNGHLADKQYQQAILKGVLDHFKSCMLMFGPLY
ncbi:hypothetical protein OGAPHI_006184 [Ogataea philodendri]|uniref:Uncharacterized protein n=1 Tax=Ogataea philodendri TaxID=1378263 RepID=A0A9P8NXD0_9ASCO|nr:uncharacterized protein OGAPHI_006184 [Ogataea philodendri]KAH3662003.1 hypothetical protein OGAPHI_006184 [Ogataea philodendri]